MNPQSSLNLSNMRRFAKHLAIAAKKIEEKQMAREALDKHIYSLKKKAKKPLIVRQIEALNDKVNQVLEKEIALMSSHKSETELAKKLKKRINFLDNKLNELDSHEKEHYSEILKELKDHIKTMQEPKEKQINQLKKTIDSLKKQMGNIHQDRAKKDEKIQELQEQVKVKKKKDRIQDKIDAIKDKHAKLKASGKFSEEDLERIKQKIFALEGKKEIRHAVQEVKAPQLPEFTEETPPEFESGFKHEEEKIKAFKPAEEVIHAPAPPAPNHDVSHLLNPKPKLTIEEPVNKELPPIPPPPPILKKKKGFLGKLFKKH